MEKKVWSAGLRALHWLLAASMIGAFVTHEGADWLHEWLGYTALVCAVLRLVWGLWPSPGPSLAPQEPSRYARFGQFVRSPLATWAYARAVLRRREPRYIGHNPLGGWMVVALLLVSSLAGITGALSVTDRFWGVGWVQDSHEFLGELMVPLVLLHWVGVAYTSWHHKDNLVAAMLHGRKDQRSGDVD
jgi:cytochrome b